MQKMAHLPNEPTDIDRDEYLPDYIDVPENSWLYPVNTLGYQARSRGISRKDELSIRIDAYHLTKKAARNKANNITHLVMWFNSMLYFSRYYQRKASAAQEIVTLCSFVASRVLEVHKPMEEFLRENSRNETSYWTLKDKVENSELSFMGELCYDFILDNPFEVASEMIKAMNIEQSKREEMPKDRDLYLMIERSMLTHIFLVYPIKFVVYCLACQLFIERKVQVPNRLFQNSGPAVTPQTVEEFFKTLNGMCIELGPYIQDRFEKPLSFPLVTQEQMRFVLGELSHFPDDIPHSKEHGYNQVISQLESLQGDVPSSKLALTPPLPRLQPPLPPKIIAKVKHKTEETQDHTIDNSHVVDVPESQKGRGDTSLEDMKPELKQTERETEEGNEIRSEAENMQSKSQTTKRSYNQTEISDSNLTPNERESSPEVKRDDPTSRLDRRELMKSSHGEIGEANIDKRNLGDKGKNATLTASKITKPSIEDDRLKLRTKIRASLPVIEVARTKLNKEQKTALMEFLDDTQEGSLSDCENSDN